MSNQIKSVHVLGSRLFGGAEHFYLRLLNGLKISGHPVMAINRANTPVAQALQHSDISQIHFPMVNGFDVWSLWRMRSTLDAMNPCVVQTYMGRATRLTRLPANTKHIHIARLGEYYKIDGYYRHAHAWVGNTRGICDYLVKSGLPASRVFYIGNFVPDPQPVSNAAKLEVRRKYGISEANWVIFSLGRLVEIKGFQDLLKAMALLPAEIAARKPLLLIAGDGPYAPALHALASELGLAQQIRWLGWQDAPEVFYNIADIFVCPSRHEPLGNVILEAWSHGLPLISTASLGARELVEDSITGLLSPCTNPELLASQISSLLGAPVAQRERLGISGREFLSSHFSQPAICDAYVSLYQQLMAERGH